MNSYETKRKFNFLLWPLYFVAAVIPLIVYPYFFNDPLNEFSWYLSNEIADCFLYWRGIALLLGTVFMIFIMLWKYPDIRKDDRKKKIFLPLLVYEIFVVLSTIVSKTRSYALTGSSDQWESMWMLMAYGVVAFYMFTMVTNEKQVKKVSTALILGCFFFGVIGTLQAFKIDIFTYLFQGFGITTTFEAGRVYGTVYNPNYVGTYGALFIPFIICIGIYSDKIVKKVASILLVIMLLISLFGSKSTTGFLAVTVAGILLVIINFRQILKHWKIGACAIAVFIGIVILCWNSLFGEYVTKVTDMFNEEEILVQTLTTIETNDEQVNIEYKGNWLYTSYRVEDGRMFISLLDEAGEQVATQLLEENSSMQTITDERFEGFIVSPEIVGDIVGYSITIEGKTWCFTNQLEDGTYYYLNDLGKPDKINNTTTSPIFKGRETMASHRGYIWGKTLPLLKDHIFVGSGPDTFTIVFPNNDYVDAHAVGYDNITVSRPHNMYLQIAVQTGIISLIAFLVFYGVYFIQSIKLYTKGRKNESKTLYGLGSGILCGSFGYMIAGLANDSTLTIAPLFFAFMGLGIVINYLVRQKNM